MPDLAPTLDALLDERDIERARCRKLASAMPSLVASADTVSRNVAAQYEDAPYPRWTSLGLRRPGAYLDDLKQQLGAQLLGFTRSRFEVLIAGCGTGRQAVSAASDYGPNARVLAFDIAEASLGHGARMAEIMGVVNIEWAKGDLTGIDQAQPSLAGRFHVVECTGVLHHTSDLFGNWRKLVPALAPNGIMLIGLYSAVARAPLAELRAEGDYPGPGASIEQLRAYRHALRRRPDGSAAATAIARAGRDFYSASGFRDYFLHVHERQVTLDEIEAFLLENGLRFRGFVWPPIEALRSMFPDEVAPGRLSRWSEFERKHPGTFAGMYQFWCSRA